jgi:hypothetical protein
MPNSTTPAALQPGALVDAIQEVLQQSDEPLTPAKVRAALSSRHDAPPIEAVSDALERQAAAQVLFTFPKYRSQHDRYWDRPMRAHVERLLWRTLAEGPLARAELRRRLPAYARISADTVLNDLLGQGRIHVHPPERPRSGPRYALTPADPRVFLRPELDALLSRLERLGFSRPLLREAAVSVLQQEEWDAEDALIADVFGQRSWRRELVASR